MSMIPPAAPASSACASRSNTRSRSSADSSFRRTASVIEDSASRTAAWRLPVVLGLGVCTVARLRGGLCRCVREQQADSSSSLRLVSHLWFRPGEVYKSLKPTLLRQVLWQGACGDWSPHHHFQPRSSWRGGGLE